MRESKLTDAEREAVGIRCVVGVREWFLNRYAQSRVIKVDLVVCYKCWREKGKYWAPYDYNRAEQGLYRCSFEDRARKGVMNEPPEGCPHKLEHGMFAATRGNRCENS